MGRTKTAGIQKTESGYNVDKVYRGERLFQRGFVDFASAEAWLTQEMDRINREKSVVRRMDRRFDEAAAHYLELYKDILWHSTQSMTAHYSMAQIVEIFEALEKIKTEANRWNISLESLKREAALKKVTQNSRTERKTG
ncbi:MAG TPA: hypothetical protein VEC06_08505 [Paucimonas sp.]|nr:hypothetical protein [Paucimonas sp.]